jgi:hypothetical protein
MFSPLRRNSREEKNEEHGNFDVEKPRNQTPLKTHL